ncbi:MAG: CPBP family intramembrane metalloprotease [Sporomusaceae bacterium]|nr:CPBP family intramembrane metalloprotease [Sporomusaceae bacterium]
MLPNRVRWNLTAVLSIHVLRLVVGLLLVRFLYPLLFTVTPFIIEVTDRLVVLGLVWFAVGKYGANLKDLGLSMDHLPANIVKGAAVGVILLAVSIFSEKLYSTVLFLTPTDHPLVAQAANAATWRQLIAPLFLAGVLAPVTEEVLYRLFTFLPMKDRWGFWGGAIGSSLVFAIMHFNLYWLGEIIIVGVGLAFVYNWTGSLISGIVAHSVINTSKLLMIFWGVSFR